MRRFFFLCMLLVLAVGCQWNRSFAPVTPSQLLSSERSRRGIAALESGNLAEAEKQLEDAVKLNKNDVDYRRHYAEVLWQQAKYQEALQQLDEAVKRGGQNNVSLHLSLAEKNLVIRDYKTAHRHADEAVRLNSQNFNSWALRGRAKRLQATQQAGYTEHAMAMLHQSREDYLRAISLAPNDRGLLAELAEVQMCCGQPEQALATWLTVQSLYPQGQEPNEVLIGKTETLMMLRRFDEVEMNLAAMRQRGLGDTNVERRLQEMMTAKELGVRR